MIKPKIVLSRCFSEQVRHNGSIIKDAFIEKLKNFVDYISLCPEMDIGLGCPRPSLIIIKDNDSKKLFQPETNRDLTTLMTNYCIKTLKNLTDVDGFILKSKSPSCGVASANIYKNKNSIGKTDGFFANYIKEFFPNFPIEDEGRLKDDAIRNHFLTRIYAYADFKELSKVLSINGLIEFHSKYKYLLMTYSPKHLKELGSIVANSNLKLKEKFSKYKELFFLAFIKKPSIKRHINTLMHIIGYITNKLNQAEKNHFFELIKKYEKGAIELRIIIELIKSFSLRFKNEYVLMQKYLEPYPEELLFF
jgi:uncharacterized protein YbgA (DUF1722 family)/uncharacterized protein YbbK (DUF523 family)